MPDLTLALVAVFGTVALVTGWLASFVLARASPTRRRLDATVAASPAVGMLLQEVSLTQAGGGITARAATYIPKSPKEMTRLQRRLALAGYHGTTAVVTYAAAEVLLAAVVLGAAILLFGWRGLFPGAALAFAGYMIPGFVIARRIAKRKRQIEDGLADALDLLIVCLEAGLGIDQAILKCAEELGIAYPALGAELRLLNIETRAGKPRLEAFKNFARRTQVDDVRALVAMLVQTDRFGTSVAQALRVHAATSRVKRRQRAEEKAAKLSVKLIFPLVFCLLPAFFVVSLGPAILKMGRFFQINPGFGP
jgi:tight adherence protein C